MAEPIEATTVVLPPPPPLPKWAREREAFLRLLPELLKTHEGRFVVVHDGKVVADGPDRFAALDRAYAAVGKVDLYAEQVTATGALRVVKIPSCRLKP
jgi:hypothetical protein